MSLAQFPEELLERILVDVVVAPGRSAALLVTRAFHRVALILHFPPFLHILHARAKAVRVLLLPSPSGCDAEGTRELKVLCGVIRQLRSLRSLTLRKAVGTYLSRAILNALAAAVSRCTELHTVSLAFSLSSEPALRPLVSASSTTPSLPTVRTPFPALPTAAAASVAVGSNYRGRYPRHVSLDRRVETPYGCVASRAPYQGKEPERYAVCPSCRGQHSFPSPLLATSFFLPAARTPQIKRIDQDGDNFVQWMAGESGDS
ncbi:hypothetical protein K438DRAFT_2015629 [Mycena galopus ATCC 62051]|nr:hypothetical protein K438DRAFT_2015629 [Mycena galopus ATCC 62051]